MIDVYGTMIEQSGRLPLLTPEQEQALARRMQTSAAARERFILHNLRLVLSVAKGWEHPSHSSEDFVQFGMVGLLKAVDGFDPERGTKFSTFAMKKIEHEIRRAVQNADMIRLPVHRQDDEAAPEVARLEAPAGEDATLADFLPATGSDFDRIDAEGMLSGFDDRTRMILTARHIEGATMQEAADRIGVSRQRVDQIEKKALKSLREQMVPA